MRACPWPHKLPHNQTHLSVLEFAHKLVRNEEAEEAVRHEEAEEAGSR